MYSAKDYEPGGGITSHPPLIAWGLDGFKIFGRYLSPNAPGYAVALDDCGGHTHDSYGYHYHSQVVEVTAAQIGTYTAYIAGPYKCWKGDISKISTFWNRDQASYGSGRMAPSNLKDRPDYELLKPCCGGSATTSFAAPTTKTSAPSGAPSSPSAPASAPAPPTGNEPGKPKLNSAARHVAPIGIGAMGVLVAAVMVSLGMMI